MSVLAVFFFYLWGIPVTKKVYETAKCFITQLVIYKKACKEKRVGEVLTFTRGQRSSLSGTLRYGKNMGYAGNAIYNCPAPCG